MKGVNQMIKNLIGELRFMKDLNIKPNFSEMSREYGIDGFVKQTV